MKAREIFRDCEYAKTRLQEALDQNRLEDAKLFWFAALAMLRAIGHVLQKVDAAEYGDNFRDALNTRYEIWKQDPIFTDFINRERNNILKEYKSSLSEQISTEDDLLVTEAGDRLVTESGDSIIVGTTTITNLVKGQGVDSGRSPIFALTRALEWWNKELVELEQVLAKITKGE